jgi:8-oxo-dGTP diphosphatase
LTEAAGRIDVALAVAARSGKLLVRRRAPGSHLAGRWEFPGGKVEAGESPSDAARRELGEETSLRARGLEPLVVVVHDYDDRSLSIHAFFAPEPEGEPKAGAGWVWLGIGELRGDEVPQANLPILRALRWRLAGP